MPQKLRAQITLTEDPSSGPNTPYSTTTSKSTWMGAHALSSLCRHLHPCHTVQNKNTQLKIKVHL